MRLYPLVCGHCAGHFQGSYTQMQNQKSTGVRTFCSATCRVACVSSEQKTLVPERGPCQHCGQMFASKREAMFCDMACYTASDKFKEVRENAVQQARLPAARDLQVQAQRRGDTAPCLECKTDYYRKRETKSARLRLFCSRPCYRSYFAARYDRWIANPQSMSLPQAYDEFLDRHELNCLFDGCGWRGLHLSNHVNTTHGIKAEEFKRAAGFNLGSGLISSDTARRLSERAKVGVALNAFPPEVRALSLQLSKDVQMAAGYVAYQSLEGREHRAKGRLFTSLLGGPERTCDGCGGSFKQSTPFGRAMYCSIACRSIAYSKMQKAARKIAKAEVKAAA